MSSMQAGCLSLAFLSREVSLSAYMIRSMEGSEDRTGDQHDVAVWIALSAVKARAGWQPGPPLDLALDHLAAVRCP
jgi:hypothetical protein